MLVVDGHLDLAINALNWNRDLLVSAHTMRSRELSTAGKSRAKSTVSLPDMTAGRVAISFATAVARSSGHPVRDLDYPSATQAHAVARSHLEYYRALEEEGYVRVLDHRAALDEHWTSWVDWEARAPNDDPPPLGLVFTMECADPILDPDELEEWWDLGLRMIGPAHFGPARYCGGTNTELGLTEAGPALLAEMRRLGFALDLSHTSDQTFWESLEHFDGTVLASHNNCRTLVPNKRHLTDAMIEAIVERNGVIGATLGNWQLHRDWSVGSDNDVEVTLDHFVDHVDHMCQLAGTADCVAIGSDLDGGVGFDEFAAEIDTVADLQTIATKLRERGYDEHAIEGIMHGNWVRWLRNLLPRREASPEKEQA